jgi:hypothetical protein
MRKIASLLLSSSILVATTVTVAGCAAESSEAIGESSEALTTTTEVLCESWAHQYEACNVQTYGGRIVSARVIHQFSSEICREGWSWGYQDDYLWVQQGCRAAFEVRVWSPSGPPPSSQPEIILYDHANFGGNTRTLRAQVSDFDDIGFDNKASSLIVRSGRWELCQHDHFDGACLIYGPGRYATLTITDSFGSARPR